MSDGDAEDNEKSETSSWLSKFVEGGMPQFLVGPAGKAISRLIGAAVEYPAAWIEGNVQGLRDQTSARSMVNSALAEKVSQIASQDHDLLERAANSMIAKMYRSQLNRDAVASVAVRELVSVPPSDESPGPSDDWMNVFERHAESATSDQLRELFGRLLAGEVRHPGEISPATLRFVSDIDARLAKLVQDTLPYATKPHGYVFYRAIEPRLGYSDLIMLDQMGFWRFDDYSTVRTGLKHDFIVRDDLAAVLDRPNELHPIDVPIARLSRPGTDLLNILETNFNFEGFAHYMSGKHGVVGVRPFSAVRRDSNTWDIPDAEFPG